MDDQIYLRSIGSQEKIEHNGTLDNFNFSLNNSDDVDNIHQLKPELVEEKFNKHLLDFFSIRLAHLEESLNLKEIEVYNIMFDLHFITISAHSIQTQLPKPHLNNKTPTRTGDRNQDLNNSRISTISRKSVSSSRVGKFGAKNKNEPQEKASIFSPKVAINIMFNKDKEPNPSLDKSILKKSIDNKTKNHKPSDTDLKKHETNGTKVKDDNKNNLKNDKSKNEAIDSKIQHKLNARKYNSDGDNFMKKNDKTFFQQTNNNHNTSNCLNSKANKNILSPSKSSEKVKNQIGVPQNNGKIQDKSLNKVSNLNPLPSRQDEKKGYPVLKEDLFNKQNQNKTNFKFEPKNNKKIDLKNKEKFKTDDQRNNNNFSEKFISTNLQEIIDKNLLGNIFNFLPISDKIFFKNSSHKFRASFFLSELEKISLKLKMKKSEENPFYLMEVPSEIEECFFNQEIILSNYQHTFNENPSFNNIVNFFYILIFTEKSWENDKFLIEKINLIENYLMSKPNYKTHNINRAYLEVNNNLRNNVEIFQKLKDLFAENPQTFKLQGLGEEFSYLIRYFSIIEQILIKGTNLEIAIDLEILSHKFDIVKTYLDHK